MEYKVKKGPDAKYDTLRHDLSAMTSYKNGELEGTLLRVVPQEKEKWSGLIEGATECT